MNWVRRFKALAARYVANLPVSSALLGPPKGFYWTLDEYLQKTRDNASYYAEVHPAEPVRLISPVIVSGATRHHDSLEYHAEPFRFYSIEKGRFCGAGGAVITPDDRLLVPGSSWAGPSPRDNLVFSRLVLGRRKFLKGVTLLFARSNNYYHFLIEDLPGLFAAQRLGHSWRSLDHIVIVHPLKTFQQQILSLLEVPKEKLVFLNGHGHLQCERFCFATAHDCVTRHHVEYLRNFSERFIGRLSDGDGGRLFISRAKASGAVGNEDEVWEVLQGRGFRKVVLEELNFVDQARLFGMVNTVVAPHGAGLSNVVFMRKGSKVLELRNPLYQTYTAPAYFRLSGLCGHQYVAFFCEPLRDERIVPNGAQSWVARSHKLNVNINALSVCLDRFLSL